MRPREDLSGARFGKLTVKECKGRFPEGKSFRYKWLCACDCGDFTVAIGKDLKSGHTKSCGCMRSISVAAAKKASTTHGKRNTPEYSVWRGMKKRCSLPTNPSFARYGGRGISIDPAWYNSFEAFISDMGPRPSSNHSIERIDNNGPYCRDNCKWALPKEQQSNRSDTIKVDFNGETVCLAELGRRLGASYKTSANYYIKIKGLSVEEYSDKFSGKTKC